MDTNMMGTGRLLLLNQWRESPEYIEICIGQKKECDRLTQIARRLYADLEAIKASAARTIVRTELATGGDIHRGVYCPSPILDIVTGNVSRGRIIKRAATSNKASYEFQFDGKNSLVAVKSRCAGMPDAIEYLVHQVDRVYGLTVDPTYGPMFISEELFVDQKLTRYCYANLFLEGNSLDCLMLQSESYYYDDIGLKSCDRLEYQAVINTVDIWHYEFDRKNGYLSTFKAVEKPFDQHCELLPALPTYTVRFKRKA